MRLDSVRISQNQASSNIGIEVLNMGGNAIDAAVAVGFSLAVTLPRAGNIGGGGFMLVYLKNEQKTIAVDFRSAAPKNISKDDYLFLKIIMIKEGMVTKHPLCQELLQVYCKHINVLEIYH